MPDPRVSSGQELYEHVRQLARDIGVRVWVCLGCTGAWAFAQPAGFLGIPTVYLAQTPDEPVPYFTALHELGHHADPDFLRRGRLRLDAEAFAWRWAVEHGLHPPGPEVWADIAEALHSYGNDRRYRRTPDFERLLEEAERNADVRAVA